MNKTTKGELTPRSNDRVAGMRFTGAFAQPDGFGSVLTAEVKRDGRLSLTLLYRAGDDNERMWSVDLDNEQRKALAEMIQGYEPKLFEEMGPERVGS